MPIVSIITTTYNHSKFIAEAIESIIGQTFTDWELLIGDDSHNDETRKVIEKYLTKYPNKIKARHHKQNKGIINNMRFLLSQISPDSQYITFLEGDDVFTSTNLEIKLNIFKKFPEVSLVYSGIEKIDGESKPIKKYPLLSYLKNKITMEKEGLHKKTLCNMLDTGNKIQSFGAVIVKKSDKFIQLFDSAFETFQNSMFGPTDFFIWLHYCPTITLYYIDKPLLLYRRRGGNYSDSGNISMGKDGVSLYATVLKEYANNPEVAKRAKYRHEMGKVQNAIIANNISEAKKLMKRVCKHYPTTVLEILILTYLYFCPKFVKKVIATYFFKKI